MALQKRKDNALVQLQMTKQTTAKKPKLILDEDSYVGKIEKIIERDFFPDLPKLSVQKAYFDALEQNDLVKLRELQMKYGGKCPTTGKISRYDSPAFFETPEIGTGRVGSVKVPTQASDADAAKVGTDVGTDLSHDSATTGTGAPTPSAGDEKIVGLDRFLAKYTSEDNASFSEILEESERRKRSKLAWLFEKEGQQNLEQDKMLALPSMEEQAAITERPLNLDTWTYKPNNAVMYVPEGVELSPKEQIELRKHTPRQVVHENTHFTENPFGHTGGKDVLQKAAAYKAMVNQGKIGHDGRELLSQTPMVNGFKVMGTPSPAPGVEQSPFMTWGEIDGTPLRLDASEINPSLTPGPVFKIPEVPKREKIAMALAEKNSKAHRAKKEAALKQVTRRLASPTPSMSPLERLNGMSPAAQRLASKRLGVRTHTDTALRASYSPSPTHTPGDKTPIHLSTTPSPRRSARSAGGGAASALSATALPAPVRQSPRRSVTPKASITDNLLNLPKTQIRSNASDFF